MSVHILTGGKGSGGRWQDGAWEIWKEWVSDVCVCVCVCVSYHCFKQWFSNLTAIRTTWRSLKTIRLLFITLVLGESKIRTMESLPSLVSWLVGAPVPQEHGWGWLRFVVQEPTWARDRGALSVRVPLELASEHRGDMWGAHADASCVTRGHWFPTGSLLLPLWPHSAFALCFLFLKHLYWSIIVLQWCVSFCFITKWISYTCTYIPIPLPSCVSLPPTLPVPPL